MIEVSKNEIKLIEARDKYKSYFYLSLIAIYILITVSFMMFVDIHKQDDIISKNNEDMAYLTSELLTTRQTLTEIEYDSKMIEDLKQIDKEYR